MGMDWKIQGVASRFPAPWDYSGLETQMKSIVLSIALLVAGFFVYANSSRILAVASGSGDLRKAFLHHQGHEEAGLKAYYPQLGGEAFVMAERWKNYKKNAKDCPAIAEVTSVVVSKTSDSGSYVIQMKGPSAHEKPDGFEADICSLWIDGGDESTELQVRDFSDY